MVDCAFFCLDPDSVHGITSYAMIPEDRYIDLFRLRAIDELRHLAESLGCTPTQTFTVVRSLPNATIVRAGEAFEHSVRTFSMDQLNQAGVNWAKALSRDDTPVNPMDTMGMLYSLAGHFVVTASAGDGLYVWIERAA